MVTRYCAVLRKELRMDYKISLKAARVNAKLTQEDVAKAIGKSKVTVAFWESGKTKITASDFIKLCELYGVPSSVISLQ
jgi:transcriptional regulator with XRE-family HTH domain